MNDRENNVSVSDDRVNPLEFLFDDEVNPLLSSSLMIKWILKSSSLMIEWTISN